MGARTTCGSPHIARQRRKGGLRRKQRNHNHSDELEEPFHLLGNEYDPVGSPGQVPCITRTARSESLYDRMYRKNCNRYFAAVSALKGKIGHKSPVHYMRYDIVCP